MTMLPALSAFASEQASPTENTMKKVKQFLEYAVSQEDAVVTYMARNMVLAIHSDASYLSKPKARSRVGGQHFLSRDEPFPPNNGAVLNISSILRAVMSSAAEAKLGAFFINAKAAIPIRQTLQELGHKQPPTPVQLDNSTALGVVNKKIQPKATKAMDMRYHWLKDRELRQQFRFYWRPGPSNLADYPSKHHPGSHHRKLSPEFLTPMSHVEALR